MSTEETREVEKLDRWLAVQEVTGRRFWHPAAISGTTELWCTMNSFKDEGGDTVRLGCGILTPLWNANDENDGSPGAVRAELHRLCPWLDAVLAPTGETAVPQEAVSDG